MAAETPPPPRGDRGRWRGEVARWLGAHPEEPLESAQQARSDERYRRIAWTVGSGVLVRGAGALLTLLTVPLLVRYLGRDGFGLWSAIISLAAWAAILDLGIGTGLVNRLARDHGRDDTASARSLVSSSFAALVLVAAGAGLLFFAAGWGIDWSRLLGAPAADADALRGAVNAAIGAQLLVIPFALAPQVFAAYQRGYLASAFSLAAQVLAFAALAAALVAGVSLSWALFLHLAAPVAAWAASLVFAFRSALPWLRPGWSALRWSALRDVLRPAIPIFLFQIGGLLVNQTQPLVLARRADWLAVADFSVLFRLHTFIVAAVLLGTASFLPTIREAAERGDGGWARRGFGVLLRVRLLGAAAGAVALVVAGNLLVRVWLGRDDLAFAPRTWILVGILLVAVVWVSSWVEFLMIMDNIWPLVPLVVANGLVTIGLVWLWVPWHAVDGALAGSAAVSVLILSWLLPRMSRAVLRGLAPTAAPAVSLDAREK